MEDVKKKDLCMAKPLKHSPDIQYPNTIIVYSEAVMVEVRGHLSD